MKDFLQKPYSLRQFIIVEKDEIYDAKQKTEELLKTEIQELKDNKSKVEPEHLLKKAVEAAVRINLGNVWIVAAGLGVLVTDYIIKSIEKQREII
jgi:hypothetical protein